jgi:hypothetical protein
MPVGSSRQEKIRTKAGGKSDMFCYFYVGTSKYRQNLRLGEKFDQKCQRYYKW